MRAIVSQLRVALIDMRGDLRRFIVLLACLALGVGTIAMVGAVGAALQSALDRDARVMLGGDLEASLTFRAANDEERALFDRLGTVSEVVESAGRAKFGEQGAFLVIRAVDASYPLVGTITVGGADAPLPELLGQKDGVYGVVIDNLFLQRTGAVIGDMIEIGETTFQIRGIRLPLPDHVTQSVQLGIPALLSVEGLNATGILKPGAIHRYRYKIVLSSPDFEAAANQIRAVTPDAGWVIRSPRDATEDLARFFDVFQRFLTIVGLSALLVGGVGVSNAVSAYITDRQRSIATLRSLGATSGQILFHFLTQVMVLTVIGIGLGLLLGALLTLVALPFLGSMLGIPLSPTVDWRSLGYAAGFGLLIGFAFGFLPLQRAQAMRPALLFRSVGAAAEGLHWRQVLRPQVSIPLLIAAAGTFGLAVLVTNRPLVVTWYAIGIVFAFIVLRVAAWLMQRLLKLIPPPSNAAIRNAIKSIYRPGAPAPVVILSLGLGLSLLLLISLIDNNLRHQLKSQNLDEAPTFVFLDLFDDEVAELKDLPAKEPRIIDFETMPMASTTLISANGVPADKLGTPPEEFRNMLVEDFPITFAGPLPEGSTVVAGEWWDSDYDGPPLVSVFQQLQAPFDLHVGDELKLRVFGEELNVKIANFRDFEWRGGGVNFVFVLSPHALDDFPVGYLGLMKTEKGAEADIQQMLVSDYSDITFLPIGDALDAIGKVINTVTNAVAIIGGLAVVSGLLVLAGAMAAGRRQREADAVVSKVLGATRGDVIRAYLVEYGLLGGLSAILAVILGLAGAWGFVTQVLELDFEVDPVLLITVIASAIVLTIAVGAATTWSALSVRPAPFLRVE